MRHLLKGFPFALLLAGLFAGCGDDGGRRDIRDYYFPLRELTGGLVYEYQSVGGDSLAPVYWYYRSFLTPDTVFLTGTYYEQDLLPLQFVREEVVSNGVLLADMNLYEQDSTGRQIQIPVEVLAGSVFPFSVRDSGGVFLYKIQWSSPLDPGATYTLVKNRRYAGDTTFVFNGKRHDAVVFNVRELLEYDREGVMEQEYGGVEFYAEGIGLVYYRKDITKGLTLEYRLSDRYLMEKLEDKFLRRYHPGEERRPPLRR